MNPSDLSYSLEESIPDQNHASIKSIKVDFYNGMEIEILNYGGIIKSLKVPDSKGNRENIVLSYDTVESYVNDKIYAGCLVGRYANRISDGSFKIDGTEYRLEKNNGSNHLHGGINGFNKAIWDIKAIEKFKNNVVITLGYLSPDGEEGYPGNLTAEVVYEISADALDVKYKATTDAPTVYCPTNHTYFNLSGDFESQIDSHLLKIDASGRLEKDGDIPTGEIKKLDNTDYDFGNPKKITSKAYDDCFVLNGKMILSEQKSGRVLSILTTFPGVQLYTADYLSEAGIKNRTGVCLETQFYPDAPNNDSFPSTVLRPNEKFYHTTSYFFKTY